MEQDRNLRQEYAYALDELSQTASDLGVAPTSVAYQRHVMGVISSLRKCQDLVRRSAMFSNNESVDELSTSYIPFLGIEYQLALAWERRPEVNSASTITTTSEVGGGMVDRQQSVMTVIENYLSFLHNLDSYKLLPAGASKRLKEAFERGKQDITEALKLLSPNDPASRREDKIARYKYEKSLEQQLRQLELQSGGGNMGDSNTTATDDDDIRRELYLKSLQLYATKAIGSLEMLQMELTLLKNMPKTYTAHSSLQLHGKSAMEDTRQGSRQPAGGDANIKGYTERLETLEANNPLLDKAGKVMRPFHLVATRDQIRKKAFGTGQYMPTMSVEEYLEEERKQGGIISGGGPQSEIVPEPNEDDEDLADMATYKARDWDTFVEANPKGSGNTMNKG